MSLTVNFCGKEFKNPIVMASGTFGSGMEYAELLDLNKLGGIITKGVSIVPWEGNNVPRVAETPSGMLNAIGLQNPGADVFASRDIPFLQQYDTVKIVNLCGHTVDEYVSVAERLCDEPVDMFELNISCPNVKEGGIGFGTDSNAAAEVVSKVKAVCKKPLIVKLTPNVTDICTIAKAVEAAGADAVSLINTVTGMKIDVEKRKPLLANVTGGLSGPAIHPIAVRMCYQVAKSVNVPVIGGGGVYDTESALEMLLAGASLVSVGCATFSKPTVALDIIDGIEEYMARHGFTSVSDIVMEQ